MTTFTRPRNLRHWRTMTGRAPRQTAFTLGYHGIQIHARDEFPLLLNRLGLDGQAVEVGVATGRFSQTILGRSNLKKLYSIDVWRHIDAGYEHDSGNKNALFQYLKYLRTIARLSLFGGRSSILRMSGNTAQPLFKDETLDFVYIDANHAYKAVRDDIQGWWPKLKPGGIIAGHDYADTSEEFGVRRAVDEFVARMGLTLYLTVESKHLPVSWYMRK